MKKLFCLLVVISVAFTGCDSGKVVPVTQSQNTVYGFGLYEFTYQDCQYIAWRQGLTHKGNCTNSIHLK